MKALKFLIIIALATAISMAFFEYLVWPAIEHQLDSPTFHQIQHDKR